MSPQIWFFKDPVKAVVTGSEGGIFVISDTETVYAYGVFSQLRPVGTDYASHILDFYGKVF